MLHQEISVTCDFLRYDDLFEQAPLNTVTYASAFAKLLASGVVHGIGDLFTRERGLFELPAKLRWTAGMVAQWISEEQLLGEASRCFSCGSCFGCEQCWTYCTPLCFTHTAAPEPGSYFTLSLDNCAECGKCIEVCPCGFLQE